MNVREGGAEQREQFSARDNVALFEFRVAIARVRCGADTTDYPLLRIATQVQDEVTDAV